MFNVVNGAPPLVAATGLLRDRNGGELVVACIKGTFRVDDSGHPVLGVEQRPVSYLPTYYGEPGQSSLLAEADIGPPTSTTDVICTGFAYAPRGRAVAVLPVAMSVGSTSKQLVVFGDRHWRSGLRGRSISEPVPFERMPIVYERAYGGREASRKQWDERNPIGTGFCCEPPDDGLALPNVEYPGLLISSWKDRPSPAGFGGLERHWLPRRTLAGTYDDRYLRTRSPLPPQDLDERFYLSSPGDQRPARRLLGGEHVRLVNLTSSGSVSFDLPKCRLGVSCQIGSTISQHVANLDVVRIRTEPLEIEMLWRAAIPCHRKSHKVVRINVWSKEWIFTRVGRGTERRAS